MHHGPTELDDTLRAFEELSVSIVDLTYYFFSGKKLKSAYISSFICMFRTEKGQKDINDPQS
jgi:hypothetical protein